MQKIVLASNNQGKLQEIQAILPEFELIPQIKLGVPEAVENKFTFIENSIIKARNAAKYTNLPAIADDSGLVIPALGGEPGINSARYSGGNDKDNIDKVLQKMQNITQREAYFYCAIVYVNYYLDPAPIIALGKWQGKIDTKIRGKNGFGYDPIFYLPQYGKTSAELSREEKNKISHRRLALNDFLTQFYKQGF
jgi:XTP/dITP diphosphohydrolase